jgi:hypothetical protein
MTFEKLLIFCLIGKSLIYTAQNFPPLQKIKIEFWSGLLNCGFCLGVWVFTILSACMRWSLFGFYVPVISELATGIIVSLVVHLISIGWQEKFGTIRIE